MIDFDEIDNFYGGEIPQYILDWGDDYIKIRYEGVVEGEKETKITLDDICKYFAYEARNIVSGCRTLGPIVGDWRMVDNIAQEIHGLFKYCIPDEYREYVNENYSHIMTPSW